MYAPPPPSQRCSPVPLSPKFDDVLAVSIRVIHCMPCLQLQQYWEHDILSMRNYLSPRPAAVACTFLKDFILTDYVGAQLVPELHGIWHP